MNRDLFAREAIAQIPKILTLLDRNPHSPTYGCFDRSFWHYKIIDFPSGMAQEFVWPLALAYHTNLPDNPYYQKSAIIQWVEAGILYAAHSAHKDGSCDDYFPFERAAGAAAFSLLACIESYRELGLSNYEILKFFERRADWLAHHQESGKLANHQALIVLCFELVGQLLQTSKWEAAKIRRLEQLLSWQNPEGWFQEYEGCDPGYQTLTISSLARLYQLWPDPQLKEPITKAVEFTTHFIHPDGSYGGEYTSRNTYNFFPHGFELVGQWMPEALAINDQFLIGLDRHRNPCYADDRIIGHHTWNYLLAWRDFVTERPEIPARSTSRIWFEGAKILIDRRTIKPVKSVSESGITVKDADKNAEAKFKEIGQKNTQQPSDKVIDNSESENPQSDSGISDQTASDSVKPEINELFNELYLAINKGGVFKLFKNGQFLGSDTQFSLQVLQGRKVKNAVGHLVDTYEYEIGDDEITIHGHLGWAKQKQMTPVNLLILRGVMLTFGRFFPNLIRKLLQKMLITGKKKAPFKFVRRLHWVDGELQITDSLSAESWEKVIAAGIGGDQTSIYVVMSRTFQRGQLQPWLDLTAEVKKLSPGEVLTVERKL